jgi:hypothetical protein
LPARWWVATGLVAALLGGCADPPVNWTGLEEGCPELTVPAFASARHGSIILDQPAGSNGLISADRLVRCQYGTPGAKGSIWVEYYVDQNSGRRPNTPKPLSEQDLVDPEWPSIELPAAGVPAEAAIDESVVAVRAWSGNVFVSATIEQDLDQAGLLGPALTDRAADYTTLVKDLLGGLSR